MKIEKNKVVALSYTLYKDNENGEVIEVCNAEKPLEFLFGAGMYGERIDEAVVEVPMEVFSVDGTVQKDLLYAGNVIPMRDAQGNPLNGSVVRVDEENNVVVMDFNNPLAGVELFFSGKIESVREATQEELENGFRRGCCGGHCGGGGSCSVQIVATAVVVAVVTDK